MNDAARWVGLVLTLLLFGGPAHAMGGLLLLDAPPTDRARLAFGGSVWSLHSAAPDAPRNRTWLLPSAEVYATNGAFASTDNGLGWNLSRRSDVQAGLRLSALPSRSTASGQPARVGSRLEHGLFLNYAPIESLVLQSSLRHGAGLDRAGLITDIGATSGLPLHGHELLGITVGASWANRSWRSSYTGTQSNQPSGWQDLQLALSHEHPMAAHWRLDMQWVIARTIHTSDPTVARSPMQSQFTLGLWKDLN